MAMTPRAFYRGYVDGTKRAGQVKRLHIIRDTSGTPSLPAGHLAWCGVGAGEVTRSPAVVISPLPARPPEGLQWCPACVGRYAESIGLLNDIASEVAAYDTGLADLREAKWWDFVEAQREVRRDLLAEGQP